MSVGGSPGPRPQLSSAAVDDFADVAPIFPVRDITAAVAHYRKLGFTITGDGFAGYRFAQRGAVYIHLSQYEDLDPATNSSAAYFYVDDADALRAEWMAAGAGGRFAGIEDTDYGLRESAHVDPDGNLLRYGSWLGDGPGG
jgi:catechol 2,3-dioxygenase-like lactoylglutathione lyase family enzyme